MLPFRPTTGVQAEITRMKACIAEVKMVLSNEETKSNEPLRVAQRDHCAVWIW